MKPPMFLPLLLLISGAAAASSMKPPMFLPLLLLITAAGNAVIQKYKKYGAVGSAVTFPAVNITGRTSYDFTFRHHLIVTYHGIVIVRSPYTQRADFNETTGEIVLRNLTQDDSGTYEHKVNLKVVAYVHLYVIEPVKEPTLRKVNETINGRECLVILECRVQRPNPINVKFLKDGEEITENITRKDNSSYLSLNLWDPGSPGTYSCTLQNPLGVKTSAEIELPTPDIDCKNATSENQRIILIIIIITIIFISIFIIVVCFILCYKYGKEPTHGSEDRESGDNPTETSQLNSSLNQNPESEEERRSKSNCEAPERENGENMALEMVLSLLKAEDPPNSPDLGHPRVSALKGKKDGFVSDHGQENG